MKHVGYQVSLKSQNVTKMDKQNREMYDLSRSLATKKDEFQLGIPPARWAPNLAIPPLLEILRHTTSCLDLTSVATPNVSSAAITETSKDLLDPFGDIGRTLGTTFLSPNLWDLFKGPVAL